MLSDGLDLSSKLWGNMLIIHGAINLMKFNPFFPWTPELFSTCTVMSRGLPPSLSILFVWKSYDLLILNQRKQYHKIRLQYHYNTLKKIISEHLIIQDIAKDPQLLKDCIETLTCLDYLGASLYHSEHIEHEMGPKDSLSKYCTWNNNLKLEALQVASRVMML